MSPEFCLVTAASQEYYEEVGFRLFESASKYKIQREILLYSETEDFYHTKVRKIELQHLTKEIEELTKIQDDASQHGSGVRYKIFPFYYKVLAIEQALKEISWSDYIVWVDSDNVFKGSEDFASLVRVVHENGYRSGYFGRKFYKCAETGVLVLERNRGEALVRKWRDTYVNIRDYSEWHDAFLFTQVCGEGDLDFSEYYKLSSNHPIEELCGKWLDHQKGERKGTGSSRLRDVYFSKFKNKLKTTLRGQRKL